MWEPTRLSLQVLAVAVPLIIVVGIALAVLFARTRFAGQAIAETVIMLPLVLPPSDVGYGLLRFLGSGGPLVEWFGVNLLVTWQATAIASSIVGLPLMVQAAKVGIAGVDRAVEDAARVDGARRWQVYWAITFPLARRGIFAGLALGSVRALGEFGATLAVAGSIPGRTQTMPLAVYDAVQRTDYALANQIGVAMVAIGYVTIWLTRRLAADEKGFLKGFLNEDCRIYLSYHRRPLGAMIQWAGRKDLEGRGRIAQGTGDWARGEREDMVEAGYTLHTSDRTTAAMQLAAHFTAEAMKSSSTDDPRARLAEQLGFFDLAFRSIMGSTARGAIKSGTPVGVGVGVNAKSNF